VAYTLAAYLREKTGLIAASALSWTPPRGRRARRVRVQPQETDESTPHLASPSARYTQGGSLMCQTLSWMPSWRWARCPSRVGRSRRRRVLNAGERGEAPMFR
jgi:hypothetical protein